MAGNRTDAIAAAEVLEMPPRDLVLNIWNEDYILHETTIQFTSKIHFEECKICFLSCLPTQILHNSLQQCDVLDTQRR